MAWHQIGAKPLYKQIMTQFTGAYYAPRGRNELNITLFVFSYR